MASILYPLQLKRQYSGSLDESLVFPSSASRIAYGLTGATKYDGQIVSDLQDGKVYVLSGSSWTNVTGTIQSPVTYKASWNASTNTPFLNNSAGTIGDVYIVGVSGSTNFGTGVVTFKIGDIVVYSDSSEWEKVELGYVGVTSVNGLGGDVTLTTDNVSEGINKYFTQTLARQSLTQGNGITYDNTTGIISIDSGYVGQSTITTLGTVTTGTWNGDVIGVTYGGTGGSTKEIGLNNLLPDQNSNTGRVLSTNGVTAVTWIDVVKSIQPGTGISINNSNPQSPIITFTGTTSTQGLTGLTQGNGISITNTNPLSPTISNTQIQGITGITVGSSLAINNTNPLRPHITYTASTPTQGITGITVGSNLAVSFSNPLSPNITFTGTTGEVNTASNLGVSAGIFAQKSGVDLQFKSLSAGTNIVITTGATTITISSTASGTVSSGISPFTTLTYSSASVVNWDVSGTSNNTQLTLTANTTTLNFNNLRNGEYGTLILTQGTGGNKTITLGSGGTHRVVLDGSGVIYLSTAAGSIDIISFVYNGSTLFWTYGVRYT